MLARRILQYQRSTQTPSFYRIHKYYSSSESSNNANEALIQMLRVERQREESQPTSSSVFKINAFNRAIGSISQLKTPIKSGDDEILESTGIGLGIKNRINEYFVRQDLAAAKTSRDVEDALRRQALLDLQRVPGIGATKAKYLVQAGCTGLLSLINSDEFHAQLSPQVLLGLKYMDHLDKPVSREYIDQVLNMFEGNLSSKYEVIPVGEYRRGFSECPSVTLIVLHPENVHIPLPDAPAPFSEDDDDFGFRFGDPAPKTKRSKKGSRTTLTKKDRQNSLLHSEVIPLLKQRGILFDKISEALNSWTGVVRVRSSSTTTTHSTLPASLQIQPGDYRRISIHLVPQKSRAAGLLYHTGDNGVKEHLKTHAKTMGMIMDEFGLWKWKHQPREPEVSVEKALSDPTRWKNDGFWSFVEAKDEEDIFHEIGLAYVEPEKRNFDFLKEPGRYKRNTKKFTTVTRR